MGKENDKGSYLIQIIVAIIAAIGVLGAALISNWDKIYPNKEPLVSPSVSTPTSTPTPTASPTTSSTIPPTSLSPDTAQSKSIINKENIQFTLKSCKRENTLVKCNISAMNFLDDRNLSITVDQVRKNSKIYDEEGNKYIAIEGSIANQKSKQYVSSRIIKGVSTEIVLTFSDIPTEVSRITSLEVLAKPDNARSFILQYKNIEVLTQ